MGEGFVKLFSSILDSSIWGYDSETRLVWITLLAMADADGVVRAAVPGIANRARVSMEATEKALDIFQSPDEHSRSEEHEGRRVVKDGRNWTILNFREHRERYRQEQEKQRKRRWWRENRGKTDNNSEPLADTSDTLAKTRPIQRQNTEAETEEDKKKHNPSAASRGLDWLDDSLWKEWISHKRRIKASVSERAIKASIKKLEKFGTKKANAIISQSLDNGWKGLFELKDEKPEDKPQRPAMYKEWVTPWEK